MSAPEMQLTEEAWVDRSDFIFLYGRRGDCACHLYSPCNSCTHPGNPLNQDENPECWEPEDLWERINQQMDAAMARVHQRIDRMTGD